VNHSFQDISALWEEEFARNRRLHGNRIRCRPGCSDCCSQLFQITEIEAAEVSRAVRGLPEQKRRRLEERAQAYLKERARIVSREGKPEAWGSLPPVGARLPCPALEEGLCSIYEHRPLICRRFGIPLWNPDRPGRIYACELNFRDGEEIEDLQLVQIHTDLHQRWKRVQRQYNEAGGFRDPAPITVARAILEDFSGVA
jgi:Fe-S-cluster containining protein